MAADDLATQGARASATMIFIILNRISVRRLNFNNDVEGSVSNCNYKYARMCVRRRHTYQVHAILDTMPEIK